jgi:hypothetical protein
MNICYRSSRRHIEKQKNYKSISTLIQINEKNEIPHQKSAKKFRSHLSP